MKYDTDEKRKMCVGRGQRWGRGMERLKRVVVNGAMDVEHECCAEA